MAGNLVIVEVDENRSGVDRILSVRSSRRSSRSIYSTPYNLKFQEEVEEHGHTTWNKRLGIKDLISPNVWRASVAELLGTATLVFLIDTIIISSHETKTDTPKLLISILNAITVTLLVLVTVPVSGGHINPIVSLTAGLMGIISISRTFIYILAQCTGAVLGALLLKAVVNNITEHNYSLGGCTLTVIAPGPNGPTTNGLKTTQAFCIEIVCSFIFLFASRWMAFDQRQAKTVGRVIVCLAIGISSGLNVFVSTTVTGVGGYSGAGINPARCLGPAIVRGGHLWKGHWIFWVGPAIASISFSIYTKVIPDDHFQPNRLNMSPLIF